MERQYNDLADECKKTERTKKVEGEYTCGKISDSTLNAPKEDHTRKVTSDKPIVRQASQCIEVQ